MSDFSAKELDAVQFIEAAELESWLNQTEKPLVIDVSGDDENLKSYQFPHQFAQSIAIADFANQINELDPDQPVVVICQLGQKSFNAAHRLIESDFSCVYSLHGGLEAWMRYLKS